eukprot:m.116835 g.116835  ORF g.116835 m.116835 type:complete len:148 (-) comp14241_c0_seq18:2819-3262(-)
MDLTYMQYLYLWTKREKFIKFSESTCSIGCFFLFNRYIYLVLPFVARHDIDDKSPLKASLENPDSDFEIVVIVEGTENTTGLTTSRQQSYCREEIFKNHRFLPMVSPNDSLRKPIVLDFGRLSAIAPNSELGNQKTSEMVVRSSRML